MTVTAAVAAIVIMADRVDDEERVVEAS